MKKHELKLYAQIQTLHDNQVSVAASSCNKPSVWIRWHRNGNERGELIDVRGAKALVAALQEFIAEEEAAGYCDPREEPTP